MGEVSPGKALGVGQDGVPEAAPEGGRTGPLPVLLEDLPEGHYLGVDEAGQGLDLVKAPG